MSAKEHNLFCFDGDLDPERTDPHGIVLSVAPADRKAFNSLPESDHIGVRVIDLSTGESWHVRRAACGLNCFCAAVAWRCQSGPGYHGPKPFNDETWQIVETNWGEGLPERRLFTSGKYAKHRVLLIAMTHTESHYASAFFDVKQMTDDWEETEGKPHCAVDLEQPPESAFIPIRMKLEQGGEAEDLREYYS